MTPEEAWSRLAASRVAVLATLAEDGAAHLVPFVFAPLRFGELVTAVDAKPKRSRELARLRHIRADPRVSVLAHHYEEDWRRLWWVRGEGTATVAEEEPAGAEALYERYLPYREQRLGPWVVIRLTRLSGWEAGEGITRPRP